MKLKELYTKTTIIWSILYLSILIILIVLYFIGYVELKKIWFYLLVLGIALYKYLHLKRCTKCQNYCTKIYKKSFILPDTEKCLKCGNEFAIKYWGENNV